MLRPLAIALSCILVAAACSRSEQTKTGQTSQAPAPPPVSAAPHFRVAAIDLGSAVAADKRVAAPTTSFAPTDTIYASVASEGAAPSVTLTARWTYEDGQVVNESTETIAPTGPAVTEFHIAKPGGWPAGKYRVEIAANGAPSGSREFEVR